ncbi:MAG: YceD family protein [Thermodesulfobacteriota bacterium]
MFTLKLDDIPSDGLNLHWTEEESSLLSYLESFSQIDFGFEGPLQSEARVWKAGQSVFINGRVQATLQLQCVRCLKEFSYPIASAFELTLLPLKETTSPQEIELAEEEMESNFYQGGELHLSEIACEQIFLEIPFKPLCQEDCRGLCPKCGKDLNLGPCECVQEEFVSGFSALKKLKLD